jgi:hypothetical protein
MQGGFLRLSIALKRSDCGQKDGLGSGGVGAEIVLGLVLRSFRRLIRSWGASWSALAIDGSSFRAGKMRSFAARAAGGKFLLRRRHRQDKDHGAKNNITGFPHIAPPEILDVTQFRGYLDWVPLGWPETIALFWKFSPRKFNWPLRLN